MFLVFIFLPFIFFWTLQDMGTIVIGKVESGSLTKNQTLCLMPNKVSLYWFVSWIQQEYQSNK